MAYRKHGKYNAKKVTYNGIKFDSQKELRRYKELKILQMQGVISDLELQKKYVLIPSQYARVNGKEKCIERECAYKADFVYTEDGETVVEDTKGFKTKDYIIKRKLMLYMHGIRIVEI